MARWRAIGQARKRLCLSMTAVDRGAGARLSRMMILARTLHRAAAGGLDLVLPPHCVTCDASVDAPGRLCADCWQAVDFILRPFCQCCGLPLGIEADLFGTRCGACLADPPPYRRARAAMLYKGVGRDLVLALKMADRTWAAPALGRWMANSGAELLADADLIVPVPLHRWRLLARRFNQSALLANTLAAASGRTCIPDLLVRTRATPSQARLSAAQRRRNVRGVFHLRKRHAAAIDGKTVLLVDDVLTTGATVEACARALRKGGAAAVDVLTLARTPDRST
jgi:ComF family protein